MPGREFGATVTDESGRTGQTVGLILAAGISRRLGRPKQLLPLDGQPIIRYVAGAALSSELDNVVIVTGHAADNVSAAVADLHVTSLFNPDFRAGQATSLVTGIRSLAGDVIAVVVLLGDQPLVTAEAINAVIELHRATSAPVVVTEYGDVTSHPILLGRDVFPELLQLTGDVGARDVIRRHADAVAIAVSSDHAPPLDVDTEQAYADLIRTYGGRSQGI